MKFLSKIIGFAVIVSVAVACGRDASNDVDSQSEKGEQTGFGGSDKTNGESTVGNNSMTEDSTNTNSIRGIDDTQFVKTAADGGLLEVRLGKLATQNGSSTKVKEFARTMVIDHEKANSELKNLANGLNISIPDALSETSQNKYNELAQKKGNDFDQAYATMMVTSHQETIELFRTVYNSGGEQRLREWAEAKIPNLEHHLQMAQLLQVGANGSNGQ
jgi:putative membrane protein